MRLAILTTETLTDLKTDLVVATTTTAQYPTFSQVESPIEDGFDEFTEYYRKTVDVYPLLRPLDLWTDAAGVTELLDRWMEKLAGGPQAGRSDFTH